MPKYPGEDEWANAKAVMKPINASLFRMLGNAVCTGPFTGLKIIPNPAWDDGNVGAKLIGCYEFELHQMFSFALTRGYKKVINVGCAEGFYAAGMAMLLPDAIVHAFDIDQQSLLQCKQTAALNGVVHRMRFHTGAKHPSQIDTKTKERALYIMDVEGHEEDLLNKDLCPSLRYSDIIVECHDFFRPHKPFSTEIAAKFLDTHRVYLINAELPDPTKYSFLHSLPMGTKLMAITERRPMPTTWLACWAN